MQRNRGGYWLWQGWGRGAPFPSRAIPAQCEKTHTYVCIFKDMGNSIWLRLLLLLSRKSTCFICMRGLPTVDWGGGRAGERGTRQTMAEQEQRRTEQWCFWSETWQIWQNCSSDSYRGECGERRREKGNKWRRWWWLKWSWRWLRKICWQNICNFRKSSENIFCLSSETRRGKMFTAKPAGSKCPHPKHTLLPSHPPFLPSPLYSTQRCRPPLPRLSVARPPAALLSLIDFCGSNVQF